MHGRQALWIGIWRGKETKGERKELSLPVGTCYWGRRTISDFRKPGVCSLGCKMAGVLCFQRRGLQEAEQFFPSAPAIFTIHEAENGDGVEPQTTCLLRDWNKRRLRTFNRHCRKSTSSTRSSWFWWWTGFMSKMGRKVVSQLEIFQPANFSVS